LDKEKTVYNGVVDVSIILVSLFENPLRNSALDFLEKVLANKISAAIPTSTFLGAYHIAINCLLCPKDLVAKEIKETLKFAFPCLIEDISLEVVNEAIDIAVSYNIESWDGYLVSLARNLRASIIYSLDRDFQKVPDISLVIPFNEEELMEYHKWLKKLKKRQH